MVGFKKFTHDGGEKNENHDPDFHRIAFERVNQQNFRALFACREIRYRYTPVHSRSPSGMPT